MTTNDRWTQAVNRESAAPGQEQEAFERASSFDPQAAVEQSAMGAFASFRERLAKQIRALREQQTGMGRLRTGWGTQDEDELVEGGIEDLNTEIARNSMHAASLDANNRQATLNAAGRRADRYHDILAGQRDYETAEANAKRERRGNLASGIGSLLGAGVGLLAGGGPAGASAGARIGGAAGRFFG